MQPAYEDVWEAFRVGGRTAAMPELAAAPDRGLVEESAAAQALQAPVHQAPLHLVFQIALGGNPQVARAVRAVQAQLRFAFLDPLPTPRLHVSVMGLDVPAGAWQSGAAELRSAGRQALDRVAPFEMRIGSANSFDVAVFLEVHDGGKIHALRAALRETLPAWTGAAADPHVHDGADGWLPHLSIGYYNAACDNSRLVESLLDLRSLESLVVTVDTVQLVRVPVLSGPERWNWPLEGSFPL